VNVLEDRLRAAFQAAGDTVTTGSAPPLRLPPVTARRRARGRPGRPRGHGWSDWLAPAAAAAAVIAVVAVVEASSPFAATPAAKARAAAWAAGLPRYYVVLPSSNAALGPRGDAQVRATTTGQLLATVKPPSYARFTAVSAAANDRTFVLAARVARTATKSAATQLRLFELKLGRPAAAPRLTPLEVDVGPANATLTGLALSAGATKVAYSLTVGYRAEIRVTSLATGKSRTWSGVTPGASRRGQPWSNWVSGVSWAADGRTLSYVNLYNVRLLDTQAPGRHLKLDSARGGSSSAGDEAALTCGANLYRLPRNYYGNAVLTPDSHLIVASGGFGQGGLSIANISPALWRGGALRYPCDASTWKKAGSVLQHVRYGKLNGSAVWVYWAGPGGRSLIVVAYFGLGGRGLVGVLRRGEFTPLPDSSGIPVLPLGIGSPAAW
jgi:hypothetical protein